MTELLSNLLTRENITLALSIFGSVGTVITWLVSFMKNRKKFSIIVNGYRFDSQGLLLYVQIINRSYLSLSISDISIKLNDQTFYTDKIPVKVLETTIRKGFEIIEQKTDYSMPFPVQLSPLGGCSGYLNFSFEKDIPQLPSNMVTAVIHSNRGLPCRKKLKLENPLN